MAICWGLVDDFGSKEREERKKIRSGSLSPEARLSEQPNTWGKCLSLSVSLSLLLFFVVD